MSAPPGQPKRDYVLVFHHIEKTGGSSLQQIVRANHPFATFQEIRNYGLGPAELRRWWCEWSNSPGAEERASLLCIAGHTAWYALESLERPTRAITLIRDPVDRMISLWYYRRGEHPHYLDDPPFPYFLRERQRHGGQEWFNPQSRALLAPHYDLAGFDATFGPPADADLWRERLIETLSCHYLVGVQEAFQESVDLFATEFGWSELALPAEKANPRRPREFPLTRDEVELIRAANWLDAEIHHHYAEAFRVADRHGTDAAASERGRVSGTYVIVDGAADASRAEELVARRQLRAELHHEIARLRAQLATIEEAQDELRRKVSQLGKRVRKIRTQVRKSRKWASVAPIQTGESASTVGRRSPQINRRFERLRPWNRKREKPGSSVEERLPAVEQRLGALLDEDSPKRR